MTAVSPRVDGPAPISRALTVGDLEAGRFTAEQLEAYVPQTRAEARALMAAKAAVDAPPSAVWPAMPVMPLIIRRRSIPNPFVIPVLLLS